MTRPHSAAALRLGLPVLAALAAVSGCSLNSTPPIAEPSPTGSAAASCRQVMDALPGKVAGLERTSTGTDTAGWGNPAITLRCGVPRPTGLSATSRCDEVNGVGWYSEQFTEAWRFTTIGRVGYIEVTVPAVHSPAADALVDLTSAVSRMSIVSPCR